MGGEMRTPSSQMFACNAAVFYGLGQDAKNWEKEQQKSDFEGAKPGIVIATAGK